MLHAPASSAELVFHQVLLTSHLLQAPSIEKCFCSELVHLHIGTLVQVLNLGNPHQINPVCSLSSEPKEGVASRGLQCGLTEDLTCKASNFYKTKTLCQGGKKKSFPKAKLQVL